MTPADTGHRLVTLTLKWRRLTLYEHALKTKSGLHELGPTVKAGIDDETGRRFAPLKLLAFGIFGVTKRTGHVYLTLEGPGFYEQYRANPGLQARRARNFTVEVNNQVRQVSPARTVKAVRSA